MASENGTAGLENVEETGQLIVNCKEAVQPLNCEKIVEDDVKFSADYECHNMTFHHDYLQVSSTSHQENSQVSNTMAIEENDGRKWEAFSIPLECNEGKGSNLEDTVKKLQAEVLDLKRRRTEEGRANEKVVSIFASREQNWKSERERIMSEHKRLWQELQRAYMEQEMLKQRSQHMRPVQNEHGCGHCEEKENLVLELKERLRQQEMIIIASVEEVKTERQEKNALTGKLVVLEADLCEAKEKLSVEIEARSQDLQTHTAALDEAENACRNIELQKAQTLQELESALNNLADLSRENKRYEETVTKMSSDIASLRASSQEKEELISSMMKKANGDAEERHELEKELAVVNAKFLQAESEKEKWRKYADTNHHLSATTDFYKIRGTVKARSDSTFDKMKEVQRLHDAEIHDLRTAFEEEVKLLEKRLSLFQNRVADLEEKVINRIASKTDECSSSNSLDHVGSVTLVDSKEVEAATFKFQLSVTKTLLSQYMESDIHREQQVAKWRKAYFASKTATELLQKERSHSASSRKNPALQEWLDLEKARSRMEHMHLQEIEAFERQLKARDERMEAFRRQLLSMECDLKRKITETEVLKRNIQAMTEENLKLQQLVKESV